MNFLGRSGIFFMTILLVGIIACKTNSVAEEEGQKAFLNRFSNLVDLGNEKEIFKQCFLQERSDITKMLSQYGDPGDQAETIEMVYNFMNSFEGKLNVHLKTGGLNNWSKLKLESMNRTNMPLLDEERNLIPVEPGYRRVEFLYNVITEEGKRFQLIFQLVDLNEGSWRIYARPQIIPA